MEIKSASEVEFAFIRDGNQGVMVEMRVIAHPEWDELLGDLIYKHWPIDLEMDELATRTFDFEQDEDYVRTQLTNVGFVYSPELQAEIDADFNSSPVHPQE